MGPPELIYHHGGYLHVHCIFETAVVDVTGAMVLAYVMYQFVYGNAYVLSHRAERQKVTG